MRGFFKPANAGLPDLVTAIVDVDKDGGLRVTYVAEGSTPADSAGYADIDELVAAVNQEVLDHYAQRLGATVMGFQFAWYPWGDRKPPRNANLAKSFYVMFEIKASDGGYSAAVADAQSTTVEAATLHELTQAAEAAALRQWPVLERTGIPGMMHWNRELASGRFRDVTT